MKSLKEFAMLANEESLNNTISSFERKWISVIVVNSWSEAKKKVLELIPEESEVMNMTSVTLTQIWLDKEINGSWKYISVRNIITDDDMNKMIKRRLWSAHEWTIWSVHAITEDWRAIIASATGWQLSSYAFWATNVIWVVGTQKIVKDLDEWMHRVYDYVLPLENERALKAYGVGSWVNKLLIVNKEEIKGRIHIIFVKEQLWF